MNRDLVKLAYLLGYKQGMASLKPAGTALVHVEDRAVPPSLLKFLGNGIKGISKGVSLAVLGGLTGFLPWPVAAEVSEDLKSLNKSPAKAYVNPNFKNHGGTVA